MLIVIMIIIGLMLATMIMIIGLRFLGLDEANVFLV